VSHPAATVGARTESDSETTQELAPGLGAAGRCRYPSRVGWLQGLLDALPPTVGGPGPAGSTGRYPLATRAYELMVIFDSDLGEVAFDNELAKVAEAVTAEAGTVAKTDRWGKRRFAYEIDHKNEGWYVVYEITTEGSGFPQLERMLRLADQVVRHKVVRLPDHEAARRGLLGQATPA
jgi:small subunit ribosomal protein S6